MAAEAEAEALAQYCNAMRTGTVALLGLEIRPIGITANQHWPHSKMKHSYPA